MSKALEALKGKVVQRDPGPLRNLFMEWAKKKGKLERLSFTQEMLMESINREPCLNRREREKALRWYSKRFQNAKDKLEERGYIETIEMAKGVGRPETFLVLTDKGFKYLGKQGIKPERLHGSLEHHCAILKVKSYYDSNGYSTKVNHSLTPQLVIDLLCEKDEERGAVEIVNSNNLKRDAEKITVLAGMISWIHLVVTDKKLFDTYLTKLRSTLPSSILRKLTISLLRDLFPPNN